MELITDSECRIAQQYRICQRLWRWDVMRNTMCAQSVHEMCPECLLCWMSNSFISLFLYPFLTQTPKEGLHFMICLVRMRLGGKLTSDHLIPNRCQKICCLDFASHVIYSRCVSTATVIWWKSIHTVSSWQNGLVMRTTPHCSLTSIKVLWAGQMKM